MSQFCCIWIYQGLILILFLTGVLHVLDTQRLLCLLTNIKAKNNCLKFLVNRIITDLLFQCIEWLCNTFLHLLHRKKLSHSAGKMRSYEKIFPAWSRSRWAVDEISVRRGNFQLIWTEIFYWWKLPLWRDLVGVISPPKRDNFSHVNSPLVFVNCALMTPSDQIEMCSSQ